MPWWGIVIIVIAAMGLAAFIAVCGTLLYIGKGLRGLCRHSSRLRSRESPAQTRKWTRIAPGQAGLTRTSARNATAPA